MFSSRKARNKRSFTTVQIVSGQLLSATVNPEQPVDISRILAAANKRCSAYCQRLPKGSATMPALAGMIYNIQLIRFTIYTIPCNGQFVYVFSTTSFLSYKLIFSIISFLPKIFCLRKWDLIRFLEEKRLWKISICKTKMKWSKKRRQTDHYTV